MASYENCHIFSQGGDLSQLSGFLREKDSGTNEEEECNLQETETQCERNETMSSRADAICEENRQINRFVELNLKQFEKKRIKLINKVKALDEEKAKLVETQKRQSEQNVELQMKIEEWSTAYGNNLQERNKVAKKYKQVEDFINKYEQNLAQGIALGENIEEMKQMFQSEFDQILKKSKAARENFTRMEESVVAELKEKAKQLKEMKDAMIKEREIKVWEIQNLAFQNEGAQNRINRIQEEIEKAAENQASLTQSYNEIFMDQKLLNESITKVYKEQNEVKTVNASRIQHLKLQINTEENINHNHETKLEEKKNLMHSVTTKMNGLNNLSNQLKEAVNETEKRVEEKVKELDLYKNKKMVLSDKACSVANTLKKYKNVEEENKRYKERISSLDEEIKLNTDILVKKENAVHELRNKMNKMEEKLSNLEKNNVELARQLENTRITENTLTSSLKENKILYQQERERKIAQNENIKQTNAEITSKITECTLKLEELCIFNQNAAEKEKEMYNLIESCKETVRINKEKIAMDEEEQKKLVERYNEQIKELKNDLDKYDLFLLETKPKQKELSMMLEEKELLEQEIKLLVENHQKQINTLENNHMAKIQEMDNEMEKHLSIMQNIQTTQETSTDKLKGEIKEEEIIKTKLENEWRALLHKLKSLKNEEVMKRNKISKMEKRQQAIMKEIKVTREDIAQAVTGKAQEPPPQPVSFKRTRLMTPSPSAGSSNSLHGKVSKGMKDKENRPLSILGAPISKQENTRKWCESVPTDEYDFSEI